MGVLGAVLSFAAGYMLGRIRRAGSMGGVGVVGQLISRDGTTGLAVRQIRDVMSVLPRTVTLTTTLPEVARIMADDDIGDVIVVENGSSEVAGIVTDRDITVRAIAEGRDLATTTVEEIFSRDLVAVGPHDAVQDALELMRGLSVRRLPVVEKGRTVGVVSLGDLSIETDVSETLADISVAPPDR